MKQEVKRFYAARAGEGASCCGGGSCSLATAPTDLGYAVNDLAGLPVAAVSSSFGCGNPLALAGVGPGEVVADIGSEAGLDCLLAAGVAGKVMSVRVTGRKPRQQPAPLQVEPALPGDLPEILDLLRAVALPSEGVPEHLGGFVVARDAGQVVGCAGLEMHGQTALLRSLAVGPGWRGDGLGRKLAGAILARARELGAREAVLLTSTVQEWAAREGFEVVPRESVEEAVRSSWEFGASRCATAVCMRLRLEGAGASRLL